MDPFARKLAEWLVLGAGVLSIAWFVFEPDFEPAIACLGTLGGGLTSVVDRKRKERLAADRASFQELASRWHSEVSLSFLKDHDFQNPFPGTIVDELRGFQSGLAGAGPRFRTRKLLRRFEAVHESVEGFLRLVRDRTVALAGGLRGIDPELRQRPNRFEDEAYLVGDAARAISTNWDALSDEAQDLLDPSPS